MEVVAMAYSIKHHQRLRPKKASTFGKKFTRIIPKKSVKRNALVIPEYYKHMKDRANNKGCDAHHFIPKGLLKQDIFLVIIPVAEHMDIHSVGNNESVREWAYNNDFEGLIKTAMDNFEKWALENDLDMEYFDLITELRDSPMDAEDIALNFIRNNRHL